MISLNLQPSIVINQIIFVDKTFTLYLQKFFFMMGGHKNVLEPLADGTKILNILWGVTKISTSSRGGRALKIFLVGRGRLRNFSRKFENFLPPGGNL